MKLAEIKTGTREYAEAFHSFLDQNQVPAEWFSQPDHFAIKCADELDYLDTCAAFSGYHDGGIWELELDSRLLASAKLMIGVVITDYKFDWVEIMQPRPDKETEQGFVEHTEFYCPDFSLAKSALQQRGIDYELQKNPGHSWINIVIDDTGREIKLNDKPLAEVVKKERSRGILRKI